MIALKYIYNQEQVSMTSPKDQILVTKNRLFYDGLDFHKAAAQSFQYKIYEKRNFEFA